MNNPRYVSFSGRSARNDVRATAIFSLFLYTGCRVSDLVALEFGDLIITERSGTVVSGMEKAASKVGAAAATGPVCPASVLETKPPVQSTRLFIGQRGPMSEKGVPRIVR